MFFKNNKERIEIVIKSLLLATACTALLIIVLIGFFVLKMGVPVFIEHGLSNILWGKVWRPTEQIYGILPMMVGTIYVTFISLIIAIPFGLATAIFLAELASKNIARIIRPAIELLAGIPSVIYGLFGMVVINDFMRYIERNILGSILPEEYRWGYSILSGGIVLAIMVLPTIINISEDAIRAVPRKYKEGALALGSTHLQTIVRVIIPAAKSGIISAIVLAMGRALGETMALIMVIGNMPVLPKHGILSLFAPASSLTGVIALEMAYAGPNHRAALFAVGIILFFFVAFLNAIAFLFTRRGVE